MTAQPSSEKTIPAAVPADRLIKLNRADMIQQLLRGIAHELRNNLQVVALGSSLGEESRGTAIGFRIERALDDMVGGLDLLAMLGHPSPTATPHTDIAEVLIAMQQLTDLQRNLPTIPLAVEPPSTIVAAIPRTTLLQILLNLIANAKEAAGGTAGPIGITVESDGAVVSLTVDNDGEAISPEAGTAFMTTRDPVTHAGIGLFVSRALAERSGGTLTWAPRTGGGTRTRLTLPVSDLS
ncbi:MAG: sensor histidine kinase [Gemmatimonadales bacterium]